MPRFSNSPPEHGEGYLKRGFLFLAGGFGRSSFLFEWHRNSIPEEMWLEDEVCASAGELFKFGVFLPSPESSPLKGEELIIGNNWERRGVECVRGDWGCARFAMWVVGRLGVESDLCRLLLGPREGDGLF